MYAIYFRHYGYLYHFRLPFCLLLLYYMKRIGKVSAEN